MATNSTSASQAKNISSANNAESRNTQAQILHEQAMALIKQISTLLAKSPIAPVKSSKLSKRVEKSQKKIR